jgi:hypothetical protein
MPHFTQSGLCPVLERWWATGPRDHRVFSVTDGLLVAPKSIREENSREPCRAATTVHAGQCTPAPDRDFCRLRLQNPSWEIRQTVSDEFSQRRCENYFSGAETILVASWKLPGIIIIGDLVWRNRQTQLTKASTSFSQRPLLTRKSDFWAVVNQTAVMLLTVGALSPSEVCAIAACKART